MYTIFYVLQKATFTKMPFCWNIDSHSKYQHPRLRGANIFSTPEVLYFLSCGGIESYGVCFSVTEYSYQVFEKSVIFKSYCQWSIKTLNTFTHTRTHTHGDLISLSVPLMYVSRLRFVTETSICLHPLCHLCLKQRERM